MSGACGNTYTRKKVPNSKLSANEKISWWVLFLPVCFRCFFSGFVCCAFLRHKTANCSFHIWRKAGIESTFSQDREQVCYFLLEFFIQFFDATWPSSRFCSSPAISMNLSLMKPSLISPHSQLVIYLLLDPFIVELNY